MTPDVVRRGRGAALVPWPAGIAGRWVLWLSVLAVATVGMYLVRSHLDKAHLALGFLLVVLGASAAGGRVLGLTVAGLSFLLFNYLFLPPYFTFVIDNPLDWLVLLAFLVTSAVAAQLLYRATATAQAATERAAEVDRLAALGAETLNAADADEALRAIVEVIRSSVDVDECEVYRTDADGRIVRAARALRSAPSDGEVHGDVTPVPVHPDSGLAGRESPVARGASLVEWIAGQRREIVELADGTVRLFAARGPGAGMGDDAAGAAAVPANVRALAIPLFVREETVGVLRIAAAEDIHLTDARQRLLAALAYYAALGVERLRLVATAERAEAERRLEALRSALLTAVSHDLRTPLTTIKGIAHEIARGADPARAAVIEAETDRLDALVADFLDLSRIHAGAVRPDLTINTADELVGAALQRAAGALAGRPVEVDMESGDLIAGRFDFAQALRALVNLLDNAAKYSPPPLPLIVRVRRAGTRVEIAVMDAGAGVPEAERERIFEAFYRPADVPPDVRGTGLGLSIARGLAEAQGGSLRYEPRPGGGSVFTLSLPATEVGPVPQVR